MKPLTRAPQCREPWGHPVCIALTPTTWPMSSVCSNLETTSSCPSWLQFYTGCPQHRIPQTPNKLQMPHQGLSWSKHPRTLQFAPTISFSFPSKLLFMQRAQRLFWPMPNSAVLPGHTLKRALGPPQPLPTSAQAMPQGQSQNGVIWGYPSPPQ